jgi:hypothetical protein
MLHIMPQTGGPELVKGNARNRRRREAAEQQKARFADAPLKAVETVGRSWKIPLNAGRRALVVIVAAIGTGSGILGIMSFVLPNLSVVPSTVLDVKRPLV